MIKKINILILLLLVLLSVAAASATDDVNLTSDEIGSDILEISDDSAFSEELAVDAGDDAVSAGSHTINQDNYGQYFDNNGNLIDSTVNAGDTLYFEGSFSNMKFNFNKKVSIVGTSTNNLKNSMITLSSGASGSTIDNLKISNTKAETYGIFVNSASNCVIKGCIIKNSGRASYTICLANGANHNNVTGNDLKCYGVTYGHGTRSTPALILSGAHYNYIADNKVEADDANGIYLSSYAGGPLRGGESNFNVIYNNVVKCNEEILPTSWSYNIQVMGNNNTIKANTVIRGYRGISAAGVGNVIEDNTVINLTGADYNHIGVETGGEYGIVGSYRSIVRNNTLIGCKVIATGAGISVIDDSVVEDNFVSISLKGRGITAAGSHVIIRNNVVVTELGSGIYEKDEGSGLLVDANNITSVSGVGILIEQLSNKRMPKNVTITNNVIVTGNDVAIDAKGVQEDTSYIDLSSNIVYKKGVITPAGKIDTSKPTYIYNKGTTYTITPSNFDTYINANGGLTSQISDGDILSFEGTFSNQIIYVTKAVKITGKNPVFYNSTFKVTSGNVLIENLTIINRAADRVNAWGIFINQAPGVRIMNNKITVSDPKAAYAVYVLQSTDIDVWNNELTSEGEYLTFTLLVYACEDCSFANNTIHTIGTGQAYNFNPDYCIDGNELVIDGKSYCLDGNELVIDGKTYCLDGNELVIDGRTYCLDGNELVIDGKTYCIDGNELVIDGKSYCLDGGEVVIDGKVYCLDGNELVIDGKSYCIDGSELVIDGKHYSVGGRSVTINGTTYCLDGDEFSINGMSYCLDGNEFSINGVKYCHDGDELTIDGIKYCLDGDEVVIDGRTYCLDGNELKIDGRTYCLDGNELVIDGKSYCIDGSELVIDGKHYSVGGSVTINGTTYCLDGNEFSINGVSYCLDGNEFSVNGVKYCIDGNELVIDGKTYCLDGGEVVIDGTVYCIDGNELNINGTTYCLDGSEYCMDGAHVVQEIYRTYGILLLYSSNNAVSKNRVNVTSKLDKQYPTTGLNGSTNSIVGIDLYYNSHNNTFEENNVYVIGNDNYIYGMGVLGYYTGHRAPQGQGATNNVFIGNNITLAGPYFATGLIVGSSSEKTVLKDNNINLKTDGVTYAITLEMSQNSTIDGNVINVTSQEAYGIELISSSNNYIASNSLESDAKQIYGILISNGKGNNILSNVIHANGNGEPLTIMNLDSLGIGNAGLYLQYNSTDNIVKGNKITSTKNYAILIDDGAIDNVIEDNYLESEKGIGNNAVNSSNNNQVADNYKYIAQATAEKTTVPYKGVGDFNVTFDKAMDGGVVKFYDGDGKLFAQSVISNGVASAKYQFDESYIPSQYIFYGILSKEDYKASRYDIRVTVTKGNSIVSLDDVSVIHGQNATLTAKVVDGYGNPIKGVKVEYSRISSVGRQTVIGISTTNDDGVSELKYFVSDALTEGVYDIVAVVEESEYYMGGNATAKLTVAKKPVIVGKNYNAYYGSTVKYKVRIYDLSGKVVGAGKLVKFTINKKTKTAKTDKNGYATYSVKLGVGKYTITAEHNGFKASNKITFKATLSAKNVSKKKSKVTKFSVKLVNKNGKILKNKKITFKLKNKKYTAKTNKKGVATLSIKNLAVGKYTITSSYGGCTIKNTIQIKK